MAENPGPFKLNPIIDRMLSYVVKNWAEQRRQELQRQEVEKQKSDPNYEESRRQLRQELAELQAQQRRKEAEDAAQRKKDEWFREKMQNPDYQKSLKETLDKMNAEKAERDRQRDAREKQSGTNPPDKSNDKFDGSEGDLEPKQHTDPLVIDLDGDGIETTDLPHGAFFDFDKNGLAELSSCRNGVMGMGSGLTYGDLLSYGKFSQLTPGLFQMVKDTNIQKSVSGGAGSAPFYDPWRFQPSGWITLSPIAVCSQQAPMVSGFPCMKKGTFYFFVVVSGFPNYFCGNLSESCQEPHELPSEGFATTS